MKIISLSIFLLSVVLSLSAQPKKYPMGVLPGRDKAYAEMPEKAALTRNFSVNHQLPPAASLRKFAPTPGHQKKYNTCTGWATAYCARTILEAMKNGWRDESYITSKAYSPGFQYRVTVPTDSQCDGAHTGECVNSLVSIGAIPEAEFLSEEDGGRCPHYSLTEKYLDIAAAHKVEELAKLWPAGFWDKQEKIERVKLSIAEKNPVVITMLCPDSFFDAKDVWDPQEDPNPSDLKHAMCVIGYDDHQFGGAIEIQNSWGTGWGNSGRIWIRYNDFARFTEQAYEIIELSKPDDATYLFEGGLRLVDVNTDITVPVRVAETTRNFSTRAATGKFTYRSTRPYTSGTELRMFLENKTPAFVYVLGTGSKNTDIATLFPREGVSAALNYQDNEIALPNESDVFFMDETVGTDYLIVLFSKSKIDLQALQAKLSQDTGHIADKLKRALGDQLIESDQIDYEPEKISFKVKETSASAGIMAMVLAFEHIAR